MNIEKFIESVSSTIVTRGECYYFNEAVKNLEFLDNGYWEAEVYGTECYDVSIKFEGSDVKEWECDCPYDRDLFVNTLLLFLWKYPMKRTN